MSQRKVMPRETGALRLVDQLCDDFESQWRSGCPTRIEDMLDRALESSRRELFQHLLELELDYRRERHDTPSSAEYLPRFASYADIIHEQLPVEDDTKPRHKPSDTALILQSRPANGVPNPRETAEQPAGSLPTVQHFRVLASHASGGMGEVFLAEDCELARHVALKQIKDPHARDAESRRRFLQEAEITGRLEHPGVVPVYALGHYPDGRPFYAMRFVRGESFKEAIQAFHSDASQEPGARRLAFRKLLRCFIDVCNTIEYAHSRGVLHRDLKPSNVMLGKYGETLVLDWGLAKARNQVEPAALDGESAIPMSADSRSEPTEFGAVIGTPAYMSPEQAAGRSNELTPASDVYSLGATLYHLLTGQPPHGDSDYRDVISNVQRGQFPRPRAIQRLVPGPLEAVCLTAMALAPQDRYTSPLALAVDIEHWLADEPVAAYPESPLQRARRWVRRHPIQVTGVAVACLVALVSLIVSTLFLSAAWRREQQASQLARQNFESAEKHFRQARDAVNRFYVEISEDTLLDEPGMDPLRRKLLSKALEYFESFLRQRGDDPSLRSEVARTWFRVGVITEQVHSPVQSLAAYHHARDMQHALWVTMPDDPLRLFALADTYNALGGALQKLQRFDEALGAYQEARRLREQLVAKAPGDHEYRRKLANTHMNIGLVKYQLGAADEAYRQLEDAQLLRKSTLEKTEELKTRRDLAMGSYNLAAFRLKDGDAEAGQRDLEQAIEAFEKVLAADSRDAANQLRLAMCYRLLADRLLAVPDVDGALEAYESARSRLALLVARNPEVPAFRDSLADVYLNLGGALRRGAMLSDSLVALQSAGEMLQELIKEAPQVPKYSRNYGVVLRTIAEIQLDQRDAPAARKNLKLAEAQFETLLRQYPGDADVQKLLSDTTQLLSTVNLE